MAIFYQPPDPRQLDRRAAILQQTGESQPPRRSPITAQNLTAIAAWWTLAAVPMPVQKPLTVVPLTLTYGQQPPVNGPITPQEVVILGTYPAAGEPRLGKPNERLVSIAPLTLAYGQQPPIQGPVQPADVSVIRGAWNPVPLWTPPPLAPTAGWNVPVVVLTYVPCVPLSASIPIAWLSQVPLPVRPVSIAPLTLAVGDQPVPMLVAAKLALLRAAWPEFGEPRLPLQPQMAARYIAPQTLAYGDQPIPRSLVRAPWESAPWWTQPLPACAAWNVPAVAPAYVPWTRTPDSIAIAWWPANYPLAGARYIAPQTLTYGTQPLNPPLSVTELSILRNAWPEFGEPRLPIQTQAKIAPLTLVYGSQPAPVGPLPVVKWAIVRGAWEPVPLWRPPRLVTVATLALFQQLVATLSPTWFTPDAHGTLFLADSPGTFLTVDAHGTIVVVDANGTVITLGTPTTFFSSDSE